MTGPDEDRAPNDEPERPVPPVPSPPSVPQAPGAAVPSAEASGDARPPALSVSPPSPQQTAPIAIVALVLAFILPVVGFALGIVSLGRVKRTGEAGRGFAITAIVVGAVLGVITMIAAFAIVVAAFAGPNIVDAPDVGSEPGSTALPPLDEGPSEPEPEPEPVPDGDDTDVFALEVGDCLVGGAVDAEEVQSVPLVDCAVPHDYEVYAEPTLSGDDFAGQDVVDGQADSLCFDAFEPYVGALYESSVLDFAYFTPTEESWAAGDREVSCILFDPEGLLTGSVRGSAR